MRRATLALVFLLPLLAPFAHAAADPAKFAYDIKDPTGDVLLMGSSSQVKEVAKPEVDITRLQTSLVADRVNAILTFAAAPPAKDLTVRLSYDIGYVDWKVTAPNASANVHESTTGNAMTFDLSFPRVIDNKTFQPRPADCLLMHIVVTYLPADDPAIKTAEGTDGYHDEVITKPSWCEPGVLSDGLNGPCPAATLPAGLKAEASLTDPQGDVVDIRSPHGAVDAPSADILALNAVNDAGQIVIRLKTAAPFSGEGVVELHLEAPPYDQAPSEHRVVLSGSSIDGWSGTRYKAQYDPEPKKFFVTTGHAGDTLTFTFCASVIPKDAACLGYSVSTSHRGDKWGTDRLEDLASCKDKHMAAASAPTPTGTTSGTTATPPSSVTSGGNAGTPTSATTSAPAPAAEKKSPGTALIGSLVALALVALARRR